LDGVPNATAGRLPCHNRGNPMVASTCLHDSRRGEGSFACHKLACPRFWSTWSESLVASCSLCGRREGVSRPQPTKRSTAWHPARKHGWRQIAQRTV